MKNVNIDIRNIKWRIISTLFNNLSKSICNIEEPNLFSKLYMPHNRNLRTEINIKIKVR